MVKFVVFFFFALLISVPVHKDDTRDEKRQSNGKEVCERDVVNVLRHAAWSCSIGHEPILDSHLILTVYTECVVTVIAIVHHRVGEIALRKKERAYYLG